MVIGPGRQATAAFLAPLPVRVLAVVAGVSPEFVHLLARLGLHHLGHLAALPAADVLARFGPLGMFAHRLAGGGDDRLPGTHDPPAGMQVQRIFDQPVHHSDAVVFAARQLAEALVGMLAPTRAADWPAVVKPTPPDTTNRLVAELSTNRLKPNATADCPL